VRRPQLGDRERIGDRLWRDVKVRRQYEYPERRPAPFIPEKQTRSLGVESH
jgi:hypothetical protein